MNAKPAAAPGDGAPDAEEPVLIKMNNQQDVISVRMHSGLGALHALRRPRRTLHIFTLRRCTVPRRNSPVGCESPG